ncbi:hypothetical protein M408DRAFT_225274 [Serendipita vermifera MAFF 305830]|uniref:Secreted peptide n=1 Tax=Serendipita vermifera MAFF 305830 TaxID=933852 RepID=A0A0C2X6N5_SERVB|nr:hypothetical protein M408DRAFT_225274 [Serendipita vermifera MAFF 305830]
MFIITCLFLWLAFLFDSVCSFALSCSLLLFNIGLLPLLVGCLLSPARTILLKSRIRLFHFLFSFGCRGSGWGWLGRRVADAGRTPLRLCWSWSIFSCGFSTRRHGFVASGA